MAPKPKPWVRLYTEFFRDPKVRRMKPEQRLFLLALFAFARDCSHHIGAGYLMVSDLEGANAEDLADYAGVSLAVAKSALAKAEELGIITTDENVGWMYVTKFSERQYESDSSTPRAKKSRAKSDDATPMQRPIDDQCNSPTASMQQQNDDDATPPENREQKQKNLCTDTGSPTVPARPANPGTNPGAAAVAAWHAERQRLGMTSPSAEQGKVERSARQLAADGYPLERITEAARNAAIAGFTDLARQITLDESRATPSAGKPSTTSQRAGDALALADRLDAEDAARDAAELAGGPMADGQPLAVTA